MVESIPYICVVAQDQCRNLQNLNKKLYCFLIIAKQISQQNISSLGFAAKLKPWLKTPYYSRLLM